MPKYGLDLHSMCFWDVEHIFGLLLMFLERISRCRFDNPPSICAGESISSIRTWFYTVEKNETRTGGENLDWIFVSNLDQTGSEKLELRPERKSKTTKNKSQTQTDLDRTRLRFKKVSYDQNETSPFSTPKNAYDSASRLYFQPLYITFQSKKTKLQPATKLILL